MNIYYVKVYAISYGCTLNRGELLQNLEKMDCEIVQKIEDADVIIIFTCTVIQSTENRMLHKIKKLKECGKKMYIGGCMAEVQPNKIKKIAPNAILIPPKKHSSLPNIVGCKGDRRTYDVMKIVPISSGCLGECTYCITRLARGELKSVRIEKIKEKVEEYTSHNVKEIRITSQDAAAYGKDIGTNLPTLLQSLSEIEGEFMIRVGMMNPEGFIGMMDSILESFNSPKIFKFFHIPVQSGSDRILNLMKRKYTASQFEEIVNEIRKKFKDATISTDIIAGFPTECDEDFDESIDIIKRTKPDILNVKGFSPRPGTPAAKMKGKTDGKTLKKRTKKLSELHLQISSENNKKFVGKNERVLATERGKKGTSSCRDENYRTVIIDKKLSIGNFYYVKIKEAKETYLIGELTSPPL